MKQILLDGKNIRPIPLFVLLLLPCAMFAYHSLCQRDFGRESRAAAQDQSYVEAAADYAKAVELNAKLLNEQS